MESPKGRTWILIVSPDQWITQYSPFTILDVVGSRDVAKITNLDGTVSSRDWLLGLTQGACGQMRTLVESNLALLDVILTEADENGILSSLSSNYDGVTSVWSV
jgi:hypothetical protein